MEGSGHFEDLCVDDRLILKRILKKSCVMKKGVIGIIWLGTENSGELS
jgi:hypothetical protein